MTKKVALIVIVALCVISFATRHESVNTFKVEQTMVKM